MILSLDKTELQLYVASQLNNFFPDKHVVRPAVFDNVIDTAIDRVNYCFQQVLFTRYNKDGETRLNHLYADQYMMFVWFLANTIWKDREDDRVANKLYYLNKTLHALDCMYDTGLPDIFLVFHGAGTMLGKASYSDYFVALQGCTIGSHKGKYPVMGKGVALASHTSIIGDCQVGSRVTLSTNTSVFQSDIPSNSLVYRDAVSGGISIKPTTNSYAQSFFNITIPG